MEPEEMGKPWENPQVFQDFPRVSSGKHRKNWKIIIL
jgi:hypothetical protein